MSKLLGKLIVFLLLLPAVAFATTFPKELISIVCACTHYNDLSIVAVGPLEQMKNPVEFGESKKYYSKLDCRKIYSDGTVETVTSGYDTPLECNVAAKAQKEAARKAARKAATDGKNESEELAEICPGLITTGAQTGAQTVKKAIYFGSCSCEDPADLPAITLDQYLIDPENIRELTCKANLIDKTPNPPEIVKNVIVIAKGTGLLFSDEASCDTAAQKVGKAMEIRMKVLKLETKLATLSAISKPSEEKKAEMVSIKEELIKLKRIR